MNDTSSLIATESTLTLPLKEDLLPTPDYVKVEKNLSAIGFFTASSKSLKTSRAKTIILTRTEANVRFKATVTIEPSATYGLPTTAHQDKTLAFQKLMLDRKQTGEPIQNPVGFHSSEILQLLDQFDSGKNYRDIDEWLNVMTATLIISDGSLFLTDTRKFARDRFHVFERAVSFGEELADGTRADRNYVWLADWVLDNINNGYLISLDFEAYKRLTFPIAKTLVPLLQIWFYATELQGGFKKRYDEFCQLVGIQQYRYPSLIKQKLSPAMEELVAHGFLSLWSIESGEEGFVIELRPGHKYFEGRREMLARKEQPFRTLPKPKSSSPTRLPAPAARNLQEEISSSQQTLSYDAALLAALIAEGIGEQVALRLAKEKPEVCRQQLDRLSFQTIRGNKAGFLRRAIEENYGTPAGYEEQQHKKVKEEQKKTRQQAQDASRDAIVGQVVQLAEKLISDHPEAISDFITFFKTERDRELRKFPQGGKLHEAMRELFDGEPKQLDLIVRFYAEHPCPLPTLNEIIAKHKPEPLRKLVRAYFEALPKAN